MVSKGQKFNKYTDSFINEVLESSRKYGNKITAEKYGITNNTIGTWRYKYKNHQIAIKNKKGRQKNTEKNYKERYEILKKFMEFLANQEGLK
ncbi:hypothetical protein ESOMN_v1c06380 [Williamsoniiplasma somnilux]|uniref:Transposase n=1 Tax=Williamsoniiplasma somnilux TaxID=215578 RepID=A0A2K8NYW3_9MOLU|nr:hypothetical protein [Williamsoniiplasma somnilux]ATZ19020.1 hypothetical protein ESOMN_v1c06380 [Williamsoniiplasma somnilux]